MANIVITGANQGIGYFLAEQLLNDGNRVAVFDLEISHFKPVASTGFIIKNKLRNVVKRHINFFISFSFPLLP